MKRTALFISKACDRASPSRPNFRSLSTNLITPARALARLYRKFLSPYDVICTTQHSSPTSRRKTHLSIRSSWRWAPSCSRSARIRDNDGIDI